MRCFAIVCLGMVLLAAVGCASAPQIAPPFTVPVQPPPAALQEPFPSREQPASPVRSNGTRQNTQTRTRMADALQHARDTGELGGFGFGDNPIHRVPPDVLFYAPVD